VLQGGSAKNIIPGSCTFLVEWRSLPSEPPAAGGERAQEIGRGIEAVHPGSTVDVTILRADRGFARPQHSHLGLALSQLVQREETGISFGSEATRFAPLADEVVVIGPGNMQTAHSDRECVPIAEIDEWTQAIRLLLMDADRVMS
jgi:acetylornithine deacetylase